jgi:hypothetical protein
MRIGYTAAGQPARMLVNDIVDALRGIVEPALGGRNARIRPLRQVELIAAWRKRIAMRIVAQAAPRTYQQRGDRQQVRPAGAATLTPHRVFPFEA